jgi:acid stress-induced BolA-like protein IbaG/YrbA
MTIEQIRERIRSAVSATHVEVMDLGGGDHIRAIVVSERFEGLSLIQQHKLVLDLFRTEIDSNEVHALTVKTFTPKKFSELG